MKRRGRLLGLNGRFRDCAFWFDQVTALQELPETGWLGAESQDAGLGVLSQARPAGRYHAYAGIEAELERMAPVDEGQVKLTDEAFHFLGKRQEWTIPWQDVTCVTTDAHYFVLKARGQRCFHIRFLHESPLKYERLCREVLRAFWQRRGMAEIVEFQPHVTFRWPGRAEGRHLVRWQAGKQPPRESLGTRLLYSSLKMTFGLLLRALFGVRVEGRQNVPRSGPFILVINHEGYLDSFFTLTLLPRKVAYLAKNSEFKNRALCWLMRQLRVIPVRRHEVDPSVVRNALRVLAVGEPVGIFVEGERTWDGRPLPAKVGTVRLLLRAGVPIVPVRIRGSFEVLPRWDSRLQRHRVTLTVGRPFVLPFPADRLPEAAEFLMQRIFALGER
ncbi:MAG: 1-acyl-sn-glycerol-3-phosphate acyltransferase [Calditrichaeota bacterium]|nr:1-acyl-sn-glycerol-3-phosphate acyltransferase [Calditrichota bacterium]